MKRDYSVFLEDIVRAMRRAEDFVSAMDFAAFDDDIKTQSAVVWQVTVVGEAVKNIPRSLRQKHTEIPWSDMAKMRDKIIHQYFGVRTEIVWNVVKERFPQLRHEMEKILTKLQSERLL